MPNFIVELGYTYISVLYALSRQAILSNRRLVYIEKENIHMSEVRNFHIKIKEKLGPKDYKEINHLQQLCLEIDQTALKLELDYKLSRAQEDGQSLNQLNEFMYYEKNKLIGYIGICGFAGDTLEVNGMVHPEYRRRGIFRRLFSLVKDEWNKRESRKMLLLSDNRSVSGQEFIKSTGANLEHSEYEMFLKDSARKDLLIKNLSLRKAVKRDAREITRQNAIYFDIEFKEKDISDPEEDEKHGIVTYVAEAGNIIVGKVNLGINDGLGGIYGLGVLPEYRGKGFGREILTGVIEKLKEGNAKDIMLQVVVKNEKALNLYKSCGFVESSTMDYYEICKPIGDRMNICIG